MKEYWKLLRQLQKLNDARKLKALSKYSGKEMSSPICLKIDTDLTYDRQQWTSGAKRFGSERFGDPRNDMQRQFA